MARHTLPRAAPELPPATPADWAKAAAESMGRKAGADTGRINTETGHQTAVTSRMKLRFALALSVVGATVAVLARPPGLPATALPEPAGDDVAYSRDASRLPPLSGQWSRALPCNQPSCMATAPEGWDLAPAVPRGLDGVVPERPLPQGAFGVTAESVQPQAFAPGPFDPVPEPRTWLLMLSGLGLIGTGRRRAYLATL